MCFPHLFLTLYFPLSLSLSFSFYFSLALSLSLMHTHILFFFLPLLLLLSLSLYISKNPLWIRASGCSSCNLNFENRNCCIEMWEWTSQQLICKLNFKNFFWICGSCCSICKLNFKNLQSEFWKFLFGYVEVGVAPANWISKIEIALWKCGNGPLNSQPVGWISKFPFWTSGSGCSTYKLNFKNRNCFIEMWEWTCQELTCNLNFENSFWIYLEVVVAPANWILKIEIAVWRSGNGPLNSNIWKWL